MIQVYTGCGKGKTTAALGLALRAAGAGLRVYIGQFAKGKPYHYNELKSLKKFPNIKVEQFGRGCFIKVKPKKEDIESAQEGLKRAKGIIAGKAYDLIILDEINIALHFGLLRENEVISMIKSLPKKKELVLTGRNASPRIIRLADLVSEIKEIKHYYKKGVRARRGIDS